MLVWLIFQISSAKLSHLRYNINVMRQSACLIINPITVDSFASLFNCTPVVRTSDSMMTPTYSQLVDSFKLV